MNYKQTNIHLRKKFFINGSLMIADFVNKICIGFYKNTMAIIFKNFYNTVIQYGINFNGIKQTICLAICTLL